MLRRTIFGLPVAMLVTLLGVRGTPALAQEIPIAENIVGTWILVSVVSQADDGTRGEPFGPNPKGVMIFTRDGHFSLFQSRSELPRLAANDRARATPEEALTVVGNSIAYYGTYAVDEANRSLLVRLEGTTYANLLGTTQRRIITSLTATELQFANPRIPNGMTLQTVWRHAAPQ